MAHFKKTVLLSIVLLLSACAQNSETPQPPLRPTAQTGEMCGGIMGVTCASESDFCQTEIEAMCGAADQSGACQPRPQMCTMQYDPVCGCDGKTYGNACSAASKGVSVSSKGECES